MRSITELIDKLQGQGWREIDQTWAVTSAADGEFTSSDPPETKIQKKEKIFWVSMVMGRVRVRPDSGQEGESTWRGTAEELVECVEDDE